MVMTVWSMLEQSFGQLNEPFHRSEIIGWFPRHYPDVNDAQCRRPHPGRDASSLKPLSEYALDEVSQ